jgi:hypothetical protein
VRDREGRRYRGAETDANRGSGWHQVDGCGSRVDRQVEEDQCTGARGGMEKAAGRLRRRIGRGPVAAWRSRPPGCRRTGPAEDRQQVGVGRI